MYMYVTLYIYTHIYIYMYIYIIKLFRHWGASGVIWIRLLYKKYKKKFEAMTLIVRCTIHDSKSKMYNRSKVRFYNKFTLRFLCDCSYRRMFQQSMCQWRKLCGLWQCLLLFLRCWIHGSHMRPRYHYVIYFMITFCKDQF